MERVVRRVCNVCFHNGLSPASAAQFKIAAYKGVKDKILQHTFPVGQPIKIVLAHRGVLASRHLDNIKFLVSYLKGALKSPDFEVTSKCTSDYNITSVVQMSLVAEAQIVIAEHGGFQSNMVYMRNSSLFIELRGNYPNGEARNFEQLARVFGVFYAVVVNQELDGHRTRAFNITLPEAQDIVKIILKYKEEMPYKHRLS
jgi:hypothetical protein